MEHKLTPTNYHNLIYEFRGQKVMTDYDLASLYEVETKRLKEQVRRNISRFPSDFMFELNKKEFDFLRSQIATSKRENRGGTRYSPMVFTEQGVAMLSSIINSPKAIQVNIAVMRTFVQLRKLMDTNKELAYKIEKLEKKYDEQFQIVFKAIKQLIKEENKPRRPIGYKQRK